VAHSQHPSIRRASRCSFAKKAERSTTVLRLQIQAAETLKQMHRVCVEINEVNMMSHSSSSQCVTLTPATAGSSVTGSSYDRQLTTACYPADGNCIPHSSTSGVARSSLPTKGKKLAEMYVQTRLPLPIFRAMLHFL